MNAELKNCVSAGFRCILLSPSYFYSEPRCSIAFQHFLLSSSTLILIEK